jgi:hypothetical protein
MFLLAKLPAAFFAGLKVQELTPESAAIGVRQKWFNKNPFHSIYFAVLAMAAEVSTGILCLSAIYKRNPAISMLVIKNEGFFYKKATGKIIFSCRDGTNIKAAIEQTIQTGAGTTVTCNTRGINEAGELVAEFNFVWSFKAKK